MRCEWDVLWHYKKKDKCKCVCEVVLRVECQGYKKVCYWLHLSPLGGNRIISSNSEWRVGKNKLKRPRTAHSCHYPCILYSNIYCFSFWEATLGPALSCGTTVCYPGSSGRFWCLMWNEVDLIWGKDSDTLDLQLSQERNESVVCVACGVCVCVSGGSGKWLVINTSDTPGLPSTFHSRVFCGLVTFLFPLVHILEHWLHLWECLWIFSEL